MVNFYSYIVIYILFMSWWTKKEGSSVSPAWSMYRMVLKRVIKVIFTQK